MRSFFFLEGSESEIGNNLKIAFLSLCMINSLLLNLGPKREFSYLSFPGGSDGKVPACKVGDPGLIPGSGRSPGGGNGNPLQCSYLENPMDREAWQATVQGGAKSRTRLSDFTHSARAYHSDKEGNTVKDLLRKVNKTHGKAFVCQ